MIVAGRSLAPTWWPMGASAAVALSFDVDRESPWLGGAVMSASEFSGAEYGARRAMVRILELLERNEIPATFFVPGVIAERYGGEVLTIVAAGHEIGLHGWEHERASQLSVDDEAERFERSITTIERLTGRRPTGSRAPSFDPSDQVATLIARFGLIYDSSLMADDEPYELNEGERPTGVVEVPVDWSRDDAAVLVMDRWGAIRPEVDLESLFANWRGEFLAAHSEGGLFQLTLHPDLIGRRAPMRHLATLVEFMAAYGNVWFATHEEVAQHCKDNAGERAT
jgi:peptidoglycan/xylan/chitin deacetylase (PgdA/CDA1 family)